MYQILDGLAFLHEKGIMHWDLKPENIYISGDLVKIGDFGMAKDRSPDTPLTQYVSTRWYWAPEVLMKFETYTSKIDIWAAGLVMAELFNFGPFICGKST